jgi:rubrerythrin
VENWSALEVVLDFAIAEEQAAIEFYTRLAETARVPGMPAVFAEFAQEERRHKARLESMRLDGSLTTMAATALDLKMADYLVDVKPDPALDYSRALIVAMKKEKAAFKLYTDLASRAPESLRPLFQTLAQEEARHKLRFEVAYDDLLTEN